MPADISYYALAVLMALASGLVGSFALMRRMTLAADVMSHIALPGLGLALLYGSGIIDPIFGGAATILLGALIIWKLERISGINTEAVIGVIFAISLAIGSLVTPTEDIIDALFGGIKGVPAFEFVLGLVIAIFVIWFILRNRRALVVSLVSKDLARTSGIATEKLNLYFLMIFALTIILGLRYLGVLLMGSLVIIPPASAKNVSRDLNSMLFFSSLFSVISVIGGLAIADLTHLALGPVTIGVSGLIFFITLLFIKK